ncbi:MAG: hypothetical protein IPJ40_18310 [Saprospirales bacterium]|nr:hypothetical protein [Saprospirales bacterium]
MAGTYRIMYLATNKKHVVSSLHKGEMFFHVGDLKRNEFKHIQGASLFITKSNFIRTGQMVLFVCNEPFDPSTSYAVAIPYDGQERKKFDQMNKEFENVACFNGKYR